jgi:hypothetical protein
MGKVRMPNPLEKAIIFGWSPFSISDLVYRVLLKSYQQEGAETGFSKRRKFPLISNFPYRKRV